MLMWLLSEENENMLTSTSTYIYDKKNTSTRYEYFEVIGDGRQLSVQGFQEHALVNIFSEQHFDIWILEKSLDLVFGESDKYQLFTKVNV